MIKKSSITLVLICIIFLSGCNSSKTYELHYYMDTGVYGTVADKIENIKIEIGALKDKGAGQYIITYKEGTYNIPFVLEEKKNNYGGSVYKVNKNGGTSYKSTIMTVRDYNHDCKIIKTQSLSKGVIRYLNDKSNNKADEYIACNGYGVTTDNDSFSLGKWDTKNKYRWILVEA